ncbi:hypothetical protein WDV76_10555 [Xenorhabdus griffiniae]|uniref:hypothetical protein n=1 Tax=Xenorhabdus griffiniae TaxID=351672 RepID=UPI0030D08567
MASKTLYFPDIKNGWYVSYFFQTIAGYSYIVTLQENDTGHNYDIWKKPNDGADPAIRYSNSFLYTGSDGKLICTIDSPESNRLDNTWSESIITPSSGEKTLGRSYFAAFEDNGGILEYCNLYVCLIGAHIAGTVEIKQ